MELYQYVYFLLDIETKEIKIGTTQNPEQRIEELRQEVGHDLLMVALRKEPIPLEKVFHIKFYEYSLHGEWFSYSPELVRFINDMNLGNEVDDGYVLKDMYIKECLVCGKIITKESPTEARNAMTGHINRMHSKHD